MVRKSTRNPLIAKGVERYSRTVAYRRSGKWRKAGKWAPVTKPKKTKEVIKKPFGGSERVIQKPKAPRAYSAIDVKRPLPSRKSHHNPTKLRKSLTPGTVVILLAGRYRGKRVVFLKQLPSGLLLCTGIPFSLSPFPPRFG